MSKLKTYSVVGHAYFVTTTVCGRMPIFHWDNYCNIIIRNLNFYREAYRFKLLGYVLMPEHLHLISLPVGERNISDIMRSFKSYTAKEILEELRREGKRRLLGSFANQAKRGRNQQHQVWMHGFADKNVFCKEFFLQKLDYMHSNPVKRGLVESPTDYKYSSARNYLLGDQSVIEIDFLE